MIEFNFKVREIIDQYWYVYIWFTPDARGTEYFNSVPVETYSILHDKYISVWVRVSRTRVPTNIHHEGGAV